ncbi:hypothetical protein [Pseudoclavibacter albus]|nr:hypothetical protein [Pseudoclavibacter alba]
MSYSTIHLSMSEIDVVYAINEQSWSNIVNFSLRVHGDSARVTA